MPNVINRGMVNEFIVMYPMEYYIAIKSSALSSEGSLRDTK